MAASVNLLVFIVNIPYLKEIYNANCDDSSQRLKISWSR